MGVMWVYGHQRFFDNIAEMGIKIPMVLKWYWMAMWKVVTPVVLFFVLIMTFVQYTPAYSASYSQENYTFPPWVQAMGWMMALLPIVAIILAALLPEVEQEPEHEADGHEVDVHPERQVVQPGADVCREEGARLGECLPVHGQHQRGLHLQVPGRVRVQSYVAIYLNLLCQVFHPDILLYSKHSNSKYNSCHLKCDMMKVFRKQE